MVRGCWTAFEWWRFRRKRNFEKLFGRSTNFTSWPPLFLDIVLSCVSAFESPLLPSRIFFIYSIVQYFIMRRRTDSENCIKSQDETFSARPSSNRRIIWWTKKIIDYCVWSYRRSIHLSIVNTISSWVLVPTTSVATIRMIRKSMKLGWWLQKSTIMTAHAIWWRSQKISFKLITPEATIWKKSVTNNIPLRLSDWILTYQPICRFFSFTL